MIYFSEIKNKHVLTEDGIAVGKIDDLIFRFTESPIISKILVKPSSQLKENLFIPVEYIQKFNGDVVVSKNYRTALLEENELFILRNLLDKQIIDIKGQKVVRVNDVVLQNKSPNSYYIAGVDTTLLGIMRWIGFDTFIEKFLALFGQTLVSSILSWSNIEPLELTHGKVVLNVQQDKLQKLHPADVADFLETTNLKNITQIIDLLDKEFAAKVIAELNLNYQISLLKKLPFEKTVKIIGLMDPDEAVDVLADFSTKRREATLGQLEEKKRKQLEKLLTWDETSIGGFLTTEFVLVRSEDLVTKVYEKIKKEAQNVSSLDYVYVENEQSQLVGVFSLYELVLQDSQTPVFKFMTQNLFVVHIHSSLYTVFRKMIKYQLSALPVVDNEKKIVGIVTIDDIGAYFLDKI